MHLFQMKTVDTSLVLPCPFPSRKHGVVGHEPIFGSAFRAPFRSSDDTTTAASTRPARRRYADGDAGTGARQEPGAHPLPTFD